MSGCAPVAYNVSTIPTTTYYYDSDYDYYDGLYGRQIGSVYYVYRVNGTRYIAPSPRYSRNPRFSEKGWYGFRPGDKLYPPHYSPNNNHNFYYNGKPNYQSNNPYDKSWIERPHSDSNRPILRPPVTHNNNTGIGRPDYNSGAYKLQAKPDNPNMHEQRPLFIPNSNTIETPQKSDRDNNRTNKWDKGNRGER